jgi:hypothetical protein
MSNDATAATRTTDDLTNKIRSQVHQAGKMKNEQFVDVKSTAEQLKAAREFKVNAPDFGIDTGAPDSEHQVKLPFDNKGNLDLTVFPPTAVYSSEDLKQIAERQQTTVLVLEGIAGIVGFASGVSEAAAAGTLGLNAVTEVGRVGYGLLAAYEAIGAAGSGVAGVAKLVGAATGRVADAETGAKAIEAAASLSGPPALIITHGDADKAADAAAIEKGIVAVPTTLKDLAHAGKIIIGAKEGAGAEASSAEKVAGKILGGGKEIVGGGVSFVHIKLTDAQEKQLHEHFANQGKETASHGKEAQGEDIKLTDGQLKQLHERAKETGLHSKELQGGHSEGGHSERAPHESKENASVPREKATRPISERSGPKTPDDVADKIYRQQRGTNEGQNPTPEGKTPDVGIPKVEPTKDHDSGAVRG